MDMRALKVECNMMQWKLLEILITGIRIKRSGFKCQLAKHLGKAILSASFSSCIKWNCNTCSTYQAGCESQKTKKEKCCEVVKSDSVVMEPLNPFVFLFGTLGSQGKGTQQILNLTNRFFLCEFSEILDNPIVYLCLIPNAPLSPQYQFQTLSPFSSPSPPHPQPHLS